MAAKFHSLATSIVFALAFAHSATASVGPVTDLTISDGNVTPDGYTRAAVLVNGQTPGPLVVGNKVCDSQHRWCEQSYLRST